LRQTFKKLRYLIVQGNLIPQGELKVENHTLAEMWEQGVQGNLIPQGELKGTRRSAMNKAESLSKEI